MFFNFLCVLYEQMPVYVLLGFASAVCWEISCRIETSCCLEDLSGLEQWTLHSSHTTQAFQRSLPHLCHIFATSLPYLCHIFATSLPHLCNIFVTLCHIFATSLPHLCHIFATSLQHLCQIFATSLQHLCRSLPHLCNIFVTSLQHLLILCNIFATYLPHLCNIFATSLPQICNIGATNSPKRLVTLQAHSEKLCKALLRFLPNKSSSEIFANKISDMVSKSVDIFLATVTRNIYKTYATSLQHFQASPKICNVFVYLSSF